MTCVFWRETLIYISTHVPTQITPIFIDLSKLISMIDFQHFFPVTVYRKRIEKRKPILQCQHLCYSWWCNAQSAAQVNVINWQIHEGEFERDRPRARREYKKLKMNRLFGRGKPKAPPPNLTDCISNVRLNFNFSSSYAGCLKEGVLARQGLDKCKRYIFLSHSQLICYCKRNFWR